jgi:4-hydroxy-2-oxoheptanedioate aldolase
MGNRVKSSLKAGKPVLGCFINLYSPSIAEMLGHSQFDFVVIDNEHGSFSWTEVEEMIRACEISGTVPIVRVLSSAPGEILKALDRGAKGIHVPQVDTAEQARAAVSAAKFPPHGTRGTAFGVRAADYGMKKGSPYLTQSNEDVLVVVQIETVEAVETVDEIMQSGIDLAFIGPTDLSVSAGFPDQPDHPELLAMHDKVLASGRKHGVPVGILSANRGLMERHMEWGANYITVNFGSFVYNIFTSLTEAFANKIGRQE